MKKTPYLFLSIFILLSCKSAEINDAVIRNSEVKDLSQYHTYVFTLRNVNDTSEDNPIALSFSNGVDANKGLVYEMLYLLRHKTTNEVLYLTTKSHKYIFPGGVFNDNLNFYNRFNILNDIDNISIGKEVGNKFIFLDPHGRKYSTRVVFSFTKVGDVLKIDSINNNYAIKKSRIKTPNIKLDDVFETSIKFQKNTKCWVYLWEDENFRRGGKDFNDKNAYEKVNKVFINYPYFFIRTLKNQSSPRCRGCSKFHKGFYYYYKKRKIRKVNF